MRLSWNEIRVRAAGFAEEWKDAHYEKGESQTFYNEFFEIFGITRRRVASFEEPVNTWATLADISTCFGKAYSWSNRRAPGAIWSEQSNRRSIIFPA